VSRSRRRHFLVAICGLLGTPLLSFAQAKVARIGFLFAGTLSQRPQAQGFWEALKELGYTPGKNVVIEIREGLGVTERLPQLAKELVDWKPDVIVAVTPTAISAAQRATSSIPIVMAITGDPVRTGFVRNLARPEGNITGPVVVFDGQVLTKRLQYLKEMMPSLSQVGFLWNTHNKLSSPDDLQPAAAALGVSVHSLPFQSPDNLDAALNSAIRNRLQALIVQGDPVTFDRRSSIASFAARNSLATAYTWTDEVAAGGLFAYGLSLRKEYRRVAPYVDRLLKGAKPADLPVEQQHKWELFLNLNTARALGIKFPQSMLAIAAEMTD